MKIQPIIAMAALVGTMGFATTQPAKADSAATTRNIIIGAAALIAGAAIEANVAHKRAQANSVEGYLPDGATVYFDGHVVEPNGQTYYPGNNGQQIACNGQSCQLENNVGYTNGGYNNGSYGYGNNGYGNANNGYGYGSYASNNRANRISWNRR